MHRFLLFLSVVASSYAQFDSSSSFVWYWPTSSNNWASDADNCNVVCGYLGGNAVCAMDYAATLSPQPTVSCNNDGGFTMSLPSTSITLSGASGYTCTSSVPVNGAPTAQSSNGATTFHLPVGGTITSDASCDKTTDPGHLRVCLCGSVSPPYLPPPSPPTSPPPPLPPIHPLHPYALAVDACGPRREDCRSRDGGTASIRCCADDGLSGISVCVGEHDPITVSYSTTLLQPVGYYEAARECVAQGMRLCSSDEVNVTCGTGCSGNTRYIWTTTSCTSPPPPLPPSPPQSPPPAAGASQDPHLRLAYGGKADFRGINDTLFSMLSAPGVEMAMKTTDSVFMIKHNHKVNGSFITEIAVATLSGDELVSIRAVAGEITRSYVFNSKQQVISRVRERMRWRGVNVTVEQMMLTTSIVAHGWELNATRKPVYNHVSGPKWRFDFTLRPMTPESSWSCYPHGIIGRSFDGTGKGLIGAMDDYDSNNVVTSAMAEGAIVGNAVDYVVKPPEIMNHKFSRFYNKETDECLPHECPPPACSHYVQVTDSSDPVNSVAGASD